MTINRTAESEVWKRYERTGELEARPYIPGERYESGWRLKVALSPEDKKRPTLDGGMVARNPENHEDQWYIAPDYFAKNYRLLNASVATLTSKELAYPAWYDEECPHCKSGRLKGECDATLREEIKRLNSLCASMAEDLERALEAPDETTPASTSERLRAEIERMQSRAEQLVQELWDLKRELGFDEDTPTDTIVAELKRRPDETPAPLQVERDALCMLLGALVRKLDAVHQDPRYKAVWESFMIHGGRYTEPTYTEELDRARAFLNHLRVDRPCNSDGMLVCQNRPHRAAPVPGCACFACLDMRAPLKASETSEVTISKRDAEAVVNILRGAMTYGPNVDKLWRRIQAAIPAEKTPASLSEWVTTPTQTRERVGAEIAQAVDAIRDDVTECRCRGCHMDVGSLNGDGYCDICAAGMRRAAIPRNEQR